MSEQNHRCMNCGQEPWPQSPASCSPACAVREAAQQARIYLEELADAQPQFLGAKEFLKKLEGALAAPCGPQRPEGGVAFGAAHGEAWQRGHYSSLAPGERLVEMDCCLFRFSAQHYVGDSYNPVYTCPLCEPRTAAPTEGES